MATTYGTSATTLLCDVLLGRGVCDYRRAFELAQAFDRELSRCGWIDPLDGVTFSRQPGADSITPGGVQRRF